MPHIHFDVNSVKYTDFFQDGGSRSDIYYFEGTPYQRGYGKNYRAGIGAVFRSLWRVLYPVIKSAAPVLKKESLETGARILNDIAEGVPVKEAVQAEVKSGAKNLAKKVVQSGGRRRKRKRSRNIRGLEGRSVPKNTARKKRRFDTFGFY